MSESKGGKMGSLVMLVVAVAIGFYVYKGFSKPDVVDQQLMSPDTALKFYLQTAWDHNHATSGEHMLNLKRCISQSDWDWFNANYPSLYADHLKLSTAINPNEADAMQKILVMRSLLEYGPNRPDALVVSSQNMGTSAVYMLKKLMGDGQTTVDMPVTLVKEGKLWKVKDFAGGRTAATGGGIAAPVAPITGF